MNNNRNCAIDAAKGIGVILVILGHVLAHDTYLGTIVYSFHMPLFFILSGVFAGSCKKYNFFGYLKKNIKSLILPYLFFLILCILVTFSVPEWRASLNLDNLKNAIYYCNPWFWKAAHLWFLIALFEAKILFYFLYKIIFSKNIIWLDAFFTILLFIAGLYVKSFEEFIEFSLPFRLGSAVMACAFYTVGYLFRKQITAFNIDKNSSIKLLSFIVCIIATTIFAKYNGDVDMNQQKYNNGLLYLCFAFAGSYVIIIIAQIFKKSKYLTLLGRESMFVYFVHYIVKNYYFYFAQKITGKELSNRLNIQTVICFLIIMALMSLLAMEHSKVKNKIMDKKKQRVYIYE